MKYRNKIKSLLAAVALGGAMLGAQAAPLEVGALNFPPYYELENESKVTGGYFIDFLKTLLTRAGVEHEFKGYPPKRLYTNVGEGTVKIWMGPVGVPEFEGKVLVSPKQISEINMEVYTMGAADTLPKSIDDFKGKSVITVRGYTYGGMIAALNDPKNNIKVEVANTHEAAFQMLQAGRAAFLLDYIEPATETLAKLKFPSVNKRSLKTLPVFIMVSKTVPDAQAIMDKIMKTYETMNLESKAKAEAKFKRP
ncbi:MAG TPA: transporter substrate-binding domain-containing protein [Rhodocyclaceae bacterium]|nr:transporter substrate-binding domain-containing protein [Rhodocyclaceae bacterium]